MQSRRSAPHRPGLYLNRLYFSCFTSTIAFFFRYTSPRLSSQPRDVLQVGLCVRRNCYIASNPTHAHRLVNRSHIPFQSQRMLCKKTGNQKTRPAAVAIAIGWIYGEEGDNYSMTMMECCSDLKGSSTSQSHGEALLFFRRMRESK